jgi:hypothetical protein
MNIFTSLTAGDSFDWYEGPPQHPVRMTSVDWQLAYVLRGPSALTLQGTPEGTGWRMRLTPAASADLVPGRYVAVAQASSAASRITIGLKNVTVLPDMSVGTDAIDARSIAEKALADCEAALATFTKSGGKVSSYTIGTRTTTFYSLTELMALRDFWQRKLNREVAKAAAKTGRRNPRAILVRF